ncbi:MAG: trans-sulfuration enzyme family protein [Cyclobacteriaceae bacterium]
MKDSSFSTKAIHKGEEPKLGEGHSGDVIAPIHLSTTYARSVLEVPTSGYEYSRSDNPTRKALEEKLASLEQAEYGMAFSSGLAAETTLIFALLQQGDEILASDDLYGGTRRLINSFAKFGITARYADMSDLDNVVCHENTKMIWLESPTNPLLKLTDIAGVKKAMKNPDITLVVDNTFASPFFQKPLKLGADVVLHSTTKYIGGHSDVVGGAIMVSQNDLYEKIKYFQNALGGIPSPFDCYLTLRGIKTLALRMEKHQENAMAVARFLQDHPKVKKVIYPGLSDFSQHQLARKQMSGYGGIITFFINGGYQEAKLFLESLQVFALAESLGGVESLIEHPASMTHASIDKEHREKIGISDSLIRVSVGNEDIADLIRDLSNGLTMV